MAISTNSDTMSDIMSEVANVTTIVCTKLQFFNIWKETPGMTVTDKHTQERVNKIFALSSKPMNF